MRIRNLAVVGAALALLLAACGGRGSGGQASAGAQTATTARATAPCTAPAEWFPTVQQPVNFQVDSINCNFHLWAWQEFLWMMQASESGPANFLTLANPNDLFVPNPLPYPGRAEITAAGLDFMPRDEKDEDLVDATAIHQAGDNSVLIDQAGQPVFYTILLDSTWYNFAVRNHFNTADSFRVASPAMNFPTGGTGAIELKTAWRVAAVGDSTFIPNASSRFFTVQAQIPTITIVNGRFVTDTTRMRQATLALAGMHVVGTVPDHPEFIWATFEQVDNAPSCTQTPSAINDSTRNAWSLYTANLPCASGSQCNARPDSLNASFKPTPVCRVVPFGDRDTTSENARNIRTLNASVQRQLPANSILRSYRMIGGQWTNPGGLPARFGAGTNIFGSRLLANLTMESFLQPTGLPGDTGKTCFGCHNGGVPPKNPKNLEVSHVWPGAFKK